MSPLSERSLFTLAIVTALALSLSATLELGRIARLVPLVVVVPTLVLALAQLLLDLVPSMQQRYDRLVQEDLFYVADLRKTTRRGRKESASPEARRSRELVCAVSILVLCALTGLLGLLVGLPLYVFLDLTLRSRHGTLRSAALALGVWLAIYGGLAHLLEVQPFRGILLAWLWPDAPGFV